MSKTSERYPLEAEEVDVYEIKANVPATDGKKEGTRALGFASSEEQANHIVTHLKHGGKVQTKNVFRVKKKGQPEGEAKLIIAGKAFDCVQFIDNYQTMPLDQFQKLSKDQQRFLTALANQ